MGKEGAKTGIRTKLRQWRLARQEIA